LSPASPARTGLRKVAIQVGDALRRAGIDAVLTGGSCASIHSGGAYHSVDVDFVLRGRTKQGELDAVMAGIGFRRHRDRYVHDQHPFFVEFLPAPLGIGSDLDIRPILVRSGPRATRALSATDSCRDRLAAFYHWNDRQSLEVAVRIAISNRVAMSRIRRWSDAEGALDRFVVFQRAVATVRVHERNRRP
jgi:hypothetical protein